MKQTTIIMAILFGALIFLAILLAGCDPPGYSPQHSQEPLTLSDVEYIDGKTILICTNGQRVTLPTIQDTPPIGTNFIVVPAVGGFNNISTHGIPQTLVEDDLTMEKVS